VSLALGAKSNAQHQDTDITFSMLSALADAKTGGPYLFILVKA
jgi:hypothetical protein